MSVLEEFYGTAPRYTLKEAEQRIKQQEGMLDMRCDDNMKLCQEIDAKDAEIARLRAKLERLEQILAPDDDKPWREKGYDPIDTGCKPPYETTGVDEMKYVATDKL
jgi:predicted RNase H-like nuclease (RuvC/YqgF family)